MTYEPISAHGESWRAAWVEGELEAAYGDLAIAGEIEIEQSAEHVRILAPSLGIDLFVPYGDLPETRQEFPRTWNFERCFYRVTNFSILYAESAVDREYVMDAMCAEQPTFVRYLWSRRRGLVAYIFGEQLGDASLATDEEGFIVEGGYVLVSDAAGLGAEAGDR